jgi:hypothetical protein
MSGADNIVPKCPRHDRAIRGPRETCALEYGHEGRCSFEDYPAPPPFPPNVDIVTPPTPGWVLVVAVVLAAVIVFAVIAMGRVYG